jgi:sucrose synthase
LQEAVVIPPHVAFSIRPNPGFWEFVKVSSDDLSVEAITPRDYLKYKEMITDEKWYVFSLHLVLIVCFM